MTRRDHSLLTALALAGLALTLYQCWYVSLPTDVAAGIDFCRWVGFVDCFESLNRHGASMLWVFAFLAGLFFLIAALALFAWIAPPRDREAWLGVARLLSFPGSGLAIYVLLSDFLVANTTSPSALAVALICLTLNARTLLRGLGGMRLTAGASWTAGFAAAAFLLAFFVHGAAGARRESARVRLEQSEAPPQVRWARFEPEIPRREAAALGDPLAPIEVLLFVDPDEEASRRVMRDALRLARKDTLFYFFADGDHGARMMAAHRNGRLAAYLENPTADPAIDLEPFRAEIARQQAAAKVTELPTVISGDGRRTGDFDLGAVLAGARAQE